MKIVDWNGDGKPDLFFNARTTGDARVENLLLAFSRQPGGGLIRNFLVPLGNMASVFGVQDMDGDGVPDLVLVGSDFSKGSEFFAIEGGKPDFSLEFSDPVPVPALHDTTYPAGFAIGDVDGDGLPDIVFDVYNSGIVMARHVKY